MLRRSLFSLFVVPLLVGWLPLLAQQGVHTALIPIAQRKPMARVRLESSDKKRVLLSDYADKVLLLNFWATHCSACKVEIPWFIDIQQSHDGARFTVVGIAMEIAFDGLPNTYVAWSQVRPFVKDHGMNYPILMGEDGTAAQFHLTLYPVSYLLDRSGRIAAVYNGVVDRTNLEDNIRALLAEA